MFYERLRELAPTARKEDSRNLLQRTMQLWVNHFPDFCGINYIYAPVRKVTKQTVEEYLSLASDLMETHPDRFVGFDLVGQVRMSLRRFEICSKC